MQFGQGVDRTDNDNGHLSVVAPKALTCDKLEPVQGRRPMIVQMYREINLKWPWRG